MASFRDQVIQTISDEESVVFSMQVKISKCDNTAENYTAMLLIKFDAFEKVALWHEVYVQLG